MMHELKTWPEPFQAMWEGRKTFEFRNNDRGFKEGDTLILKEWNPINEEYTGRVVSGVVTYLIWEGFDVPEGYCIMSLTDIMIYRQERFP